MHMLPGRLAIAISLYNRWDELGGLLDLLRLNWKSGSQLHITVITTALEQDMPGWIDTSLIDDLQFGSSHPMPAFPILGRLERIPGLQTVVAEQRHVVLKRIIRTRTVDSIIRGCRAGMQSGRNYTMHLHAAAWPMMEDKIYGLLDRMRQGRFVFAGRGYGREWIDEKRPAGDIDDNFFVIENAFARASKFWEFDPDLDADRVTNEGRLARRVYGKCPDNAILLYDRFQNPQEYVFPPGGDQRRVQPYNYFKPMGLLRSHDMSQQAKYCQEFGYRGPVIDEIIARQQVELKNVHA